MQLDREINKVNSVINYYGGKKYLRSKIISLFPQGYTHYTEAFFGGGWVLFGTDGINISETVNDVSKELSNFWFILKNNFEELKSTLEKTPFSSISFEESNHSSIDSVVNAANFFIRCKQSILGQGKQFRIPTKRTRRGMNEHVSSWLNAIDGLHEVHNRLKRVEIRNMDFEKFLKMYDHEKCFHYLDPPYLPSTRVTTDSYVHEMSEDDHVRLLNFLEKTKGKFALSGYNSELYTEYANRNNWERVEFEIDNKASKKSKKEIKIECIWRNYANITLV